MELLVVVLIIGILAATAVPQYQKAVAKSRYINLMVATDALYKAQKMYYMANGSYADTLDQLDVDMPGFGIKGNGQTYQGKTVSYQINVDGGDMVMGISNQAPLNNYYLVHYNTGKRSCRAYSEGIPHYVCRAFGGVQRGAGSAFYDLP